MSNAVDSFAEYGISSEHGLILERFYGEITVELVKAASKSIWSQPNYERTHKGLADLRECKFTMSLRDIIKLVLFLAKSEKTATGFFVILVHDSEGVAKSLIFNSRMGSIMNLHVVSHLDSALRHLAISQETFDKIMSKELIRVDA